MVTSKQRQRQLARAKWQRQQYRRLRTASRQRKIAVVLGVVFAVVAVVLLALLVKNIVSDEQSRSPGVPTDTFSTDLLSPSRNTDSPTPTQPTTSAPTKPTSTKPSTTGGN